METVAGTPTVDSSSSPAVQPFVLREHEGRANTVYNVFGMDKFVKISGDDTDGRFVLFFGLYAKHDSAPMHIHIGEDETFYVLEGEVLFQVDNERHTLQPGDTIFLPRTHPHTYLVLSDTARMLFMLSPAGKNEAFFQLLSQLKTLPSPAEMQEIFGAYGQKLVGPPLKAD